MVDAELFYEREAEYFGFTPYKFLDEVGTRVVGAVLGVFERLTGRLASLPFLGRGQSEAGLGQWSAFVEARFGRNYELFETYVVKNVLCLPDAFVLPHRRLDQCTSLSGKSQSEPSVQIQSLELLENLDHADANICSLLERKKSAELETCRLMALKHEIERQELIISQVENQFSILQEKLARCEFLHFLISKN